MNLYCLCYEKASWSSLQCTLDEKKCCREKQKTLTLLITNSRKTILTFDFQTLPLFTHEKSPRIVFLSSSPCDVSIAPCAHLQYLHMCNDDKQG